MMADEKKIEDFREQMETIAAHGVLSLAIAFGYKLQLFDSLAKISNELSPKTAKQLADSAGMKER
jgi:hypothetical protein